MSAEWKSYLQDRLIRKDPAGFYVIIPESSEHSLPLACNVCNMLLRSREDEESCREFDCCYRCALKWAHSRRQQWKDGWRPTQEEVDSDVLSRVGLSITFEFD